VHRFAVTRLQQPTSGSEDQKKGKKCVIHSTVHEGAVVQPVDSEVMQLKALGNGQMLAMSFNIFRTCDGFTSLSGV
jgi:hypothetical protein